MSLAISQHIFYANYWVACLRSFLCALVECFLNARDVLVWHVVTSSGIFEDAAKVTVLAADVLVDGFNIANDASELACATTLLFVKIVEVGSLADCLSVIDCRIADNEVNVVLALHSFAVNKQVQLSHSTDNDFLRFFVLYNCKCRILSLEPI